MKSRFVVAFVSAALLLQANVLAFAAGRNDSEERFRQQQQEARSQQEQALRAQEEAARNAQRQQEQEQRRVEEQAQRQQEAAQRQAQEQTQRQQEAAQRQAQEQAQRQQEAAQRQAQEQAQRQQEAAQRQAQEQAQRQQQAAERQAQEQAQREQVAAQQRLQDQAMHEQATAQRRDQEEAQRAQLAAQHQFETAQKSAQEQLNQQQALQRHAAQPTREMQVEQWRAQAVPPPAVQPPARELPPTTIARPSGVSPVVEPRTSIPSEVRLPATTPGAGTPPSFILNRRAVPRPLNVKALPLKQAVSIPVIDSNLTPEEAQHCQVITRNLQQHLLPVPMSQAPRNVYQVRNIAIDNYYNNYNTIINEQPICINRSTTFINPVPTYQYPYWYQPQQGWVFSNGFTLGNLFRIGLDWLGFGWHPYYGPAPQGFIAAADYMPTEWIYVPAYGLWRHVGLPGWAPGGPPLWYTGPISVEVLEPRHVGVRDPFTGWSHRRVVNVVYLYNAFFYPMYDRWAYLNRHGNFIWLNT